MIESTEEIDQILKEDKMSEVNEQSGSPRDSRNGAINSGLTCGSQVPNPIAKPVDHKAIEGTNAGDHRADANQVTMPPQNAPRSTTGTKGA